MTGVKDRYKGKLFSVLGDSISTFEGFSEPRDAVFYDTPTKITSGVVTVGDTWWGKVVDELGGEILVNDSFSGSTVCRHPLAEIPSYACGDERTSSLGREKVAPDVIIVFMGTNDWGQGFGIRYGDTSGDLANFYVAYKTTLKKLKKNYPRAEIWCITLATRGAKEIYAELAACRGIKDVAEYSAAIGVCAKEESCRLIDLSRFDAPYRTIDGLHPDALGMTAIAQAVLFELNSSDERDFQGE